MLQKEECFAKGFGDNVFFLSLFLMPERFSSREIHNTHNTRSTLMSHYFIPFH